MAFLTVAEEADAELDVLSEAHESDVGLMDALFEHLQESPEVLDSLCRDVPKWHYDFKPPFEIKRFQSCWRSGMRVYVLKPYDEAGHLIDFRIFLGYDDSTDDYFVLSVQPRATCYDTSTQSYRDLCDRYRHLNIPTIVR